MDGRRKHDVTNGMEDRWQLKWNVMVDETKERSLKKSFR
jgi:hypothetical protein